MAFPLCDVPQYRKLIMTSRTIEKDSCRYWYCTIENNKHMDGCNLPAKNAKKDQKDLQLNIKIRRKLMRGDKTVKNNNCKRWRYIIKETSHIGFVNVYSSLTMNCKKNASQWVSTERCHQSVNSLNSNYFNAHIKS